MRYGAPSRMRHALPPITVLLLASGCRGPQHILDSGGVQGSRITSLWWVMFWLGALVFVVVMAALFLAFWRHRAQDVGSAPHPGEARATAADGLLWKPVGSAIGVTALILVVLVAFSVSTGRGITSLAAEEGLTVEVIGHQWWWEIRYRDPIPARGFTTANELVLPVGQPVRVVVQSRDVIHSFWVPNLHGKVDLIPGRENTLWLQADQPGEWRGQCAEYCGLQHARMAFHVIALPAPEWEAWARRQSQPAPPPSDSVALLGREVFESSTCAICHTVRGTSGRGKVAPDLTHLASRRTIAAGTLPNTRGHLAGWILDPQRVKPGNFMPPTDLDAASLQALLHWLGTLH